MPMSSNGVLEQRGASHLSGLFARVGEALADRENAGHVARIPREAIGCGPAPIDYSRRVSSAMQERGDGAISSWLHSQHLTTC